MALTDVAMLFAWSTGVVPSAIRSKGKDVPRRFPLVERLWTRFRTWQAQRETARLLYSVDRATLHDLGISPREIESLVYGEGNDRVRRYDPNWWRK
jgi:uncharacterized protein YjiS (DUF1127 family)